MASERLTADDLDLIDQRLDELDSSGIKTVHPWHRRAVAELRERRAADLQVDDYEAVNLLWLLRVARTLRLDTGDWHAQLVYKLKTRGTGSLREANWSESVTAQHIAELRGPTRSATDREVLSTLRDMVRDMNVAVWHHRQDEAVERKATALAALDKLLARGGER